ncbi:MAG TPA: gamma-glutamyl-gamma-aminobutyrate hydrolase family protein [Tepidisphaeraceae bacterium]|nr:gamma-glutamyl-gamma-aminobutyrate hydrolase family protein [Tepidisphaeraceae bacterium]
MKRPVIGLTTDYNDEKQDRYLSTMTYAGAIEAAGGLPVLLPYAVDQTLIPQYVDLLDGICFSGGDDMNPVRYGEEWHPKVRRMDPRREAFEFALLEEVEKRRLPALGVCFGSQLMNVYRGGSLTQFLPEFQRDNSLEHRKLPDQDPSRHMVKVDTTTQLGKALGASEISVNTYHKQAVNHLGRGLKLVATAPDGVIEGFEDPTFPLFAAVQWHPERLYEEKEHLAPFKLLVEKSRSA